MYFVRLHLNKPVTKPKEIGFRASNSSSGKNQVTGAVQANEGGKAVRAACARNDTETGLGECDASCGCENAKIGGERKFKTTAKGKGGECGYGGNRQVGERGEGFAKGEEEVGCSKTSNGEFSF